MTVSILSSPISLAHIDIPIDISLMSDLPYRSPIPVSISHIDIGSYLVTLYACARVPEAGSDTALPIQQLLDCHIMVFRYTKSIQ